MSCLVNREDQTQVVRGGSKCLRQAQVFKHVVGLLQTPTVPFTHWCFVIPSDNRDAKPSALPPTHTPAPPWEI